ncbi:MAG: TIM barrel protein [Rhodobacteraceae bacterium]|nr:TIM barrel protein [Paracoccaceae bacterium]
MPRFAANLTMLFTELPFLARFDAARRAGFQGVEFLFPYDHDADEIHRALDDCGLPLILFNTPPGDWASGERGHAALPGCAAEFGEAQRLAFQYSRILEPRFLHVMAGNAAGPEAASCFRDNLAALAARNPDQDFLIEPLNPHDMPGYFLNDFKTSREILEGIAAPNLHLQFDAYHAGRITGDALGQWQTSRDLVRHVQIAGYPGRHEPTGGEIDYPAFFARLDADGYDGFVSAEYNPATTTTEGLGWMHTASTVF